MKLLVFFLGVALGMLGSLLGVAAYIDAETYDSSRWWNGCKEGYKFAQIERQQKVAPCAAFSEFIAELHAWYKGEQERDDWLFLTGEDDAPADSRVIRAYWFLDGEFWCESYTRGDAFADRRWADLPPSNSLIPVVVTKVEEIAATGGLRNVRYDCTRRPEEWTRMKNYLESHPQEKP